MRAITALALKLITLTIPGADYCLIVDNVETKEDVIGLTKDRGKGIKDKRKRNGSRIKAEG